MPGKTACWRRLDAGHMAHVRVEYRLSTRPPSPHSSRAMARGHHVARRKLQQRTWYRLQPAFAPVVAQISALAAQRLRKQKPRHAGQRQRRGMKLIKLHIGQRCASLPRQRNAVSGSKPCVGVVGGVGGRLLPRSSGSESPRIPTTPRALTRCATESATAESAIAESPRVSLAPARSAPNHSPIRKPPARSPSSIRQT